MKTAWLQQRFGIKQKILLVLVGVLALTTVLDALLASYLTDRQNQQAAFATLHNELQAWQSDLAATSGQLRQLAVATVGDAVVLNQLAELMTLEFNLDDPALASERREMTRTLAYRKSVSLNRLQLALRAGGFSSISVYSHGVLSHYVSTTAAGMRIYHGGHNVWISASADAHGELPFQTWPAWSETLAPTDAGPPMPAKPAVFFTFPSSGMAMIEVAVPVRGLVEDVLTDNAGKPRARFYSQLAVAGTSHPAPAEPALGVNAKLDTFALVVFRKPIDRAALEEIAKKTGKRPLLFSPDGRHRQQLDALDLIPAAMLAQAQGAPGQAVQRIVNIKQKSFYVALLPWQFEGRPRLILGLATPRDGTLSNIRQTVAAILAVAVIILLLSMTVGILWIKRLIDPIVRLTATVKRITDVKGQEDTPRFGPGSSEWLQPVDAGAPDEVGDLAQAFNAMLTELRQSFDTLEQRVQARTAELRQQTRYVHTLFDTLPLPVWLKDTHGRYLAANQASAAACSRTVDGMIGKADTDLWPADLAQHMHADEAEVMATRERKIVECEMPLAGENTPVWMEIYYAPVLDEDGTLLGTVGVARNISEHKATEAARELALAESIRLARLRSEFLAQMSHELRTPLNGILGYAQILLRNGSLSDKQQTGLNVIQQSGEHLLTLINDILDFTKIEAGKLALAPGEVPLTRFLHSLAEIVRVKAEQKKLEFACDLGPDLPEYVCVDEKRLRQVLLNLLSNAVKFTDNGRVCLRVGLADGQRLRFTVEDTGIGIDPDQREAIFRPFEQAGEVHRHQGGTGLGLAISRQLVRLMGSDIHMHSESGHGSTFWFEIDAPMVQSEHSLIMPMLDRTPTAYEGPRKKILVVDDIAENRAVLSDMLGHLGFDIMEAVDGPSTLKQVSSAQPDLILMDTIMPHMDGLEVTRRLRQTPACAATPIIAISASVSNFDESGTLAAGANVFLPKPVKLDILLTHIAELLKLTWVLTPAQPQAPAELVVPPPHEIAILHSLALQGNMREILRRLAAIAETDHRYHAFAEQLGALARSYQSRALLRLVEQFLKEEPTS